MWTGISEPDPTTLFRAALEAPGMTPGLRIGDNPSLLDLALRQHFDCHGRRCQPRVPIIKLEGPGNLTCFTSWKAA
jgi:hypothetical protein